MLSYHRCLSLHDNNPDGWKIYQSFLSHCDERKANNSEMWNYQHEHGVDFVRYKSFSCSFHQILESEVIPHNLK